MSRPVDSCIHENRHVLSNNGSLFEEGRVAVARSKSRCGLLE